MKKTTTTNRRSFVTRWPEGLTSDGVCFKIGKLKMRPAPPTKAQVLRALPVSPVHCAVFSQSSGYVTRDIEAVEASSPMRFHVEQTGAVTHVWRVA